MINKVTIKNFKAIQAAVAVKLTDLTVFIGNNGSGKSSIIEALQTLQTVLLYGLSAGFNDRWFGLDHIRCASVAPSRKRTAMFEHEDIHIELTGELGKDTYRYAASFNATLNGDLYLVTSESLKHNSKSIFNAEIIDHTGNAELFLENDPQPIHYVANHLALADKQLHHDHAFALQLAKYIASWQFLSLEPERMYFPAKRDYSQTHIRMKSTGENIADFFSRLQDDVSKNDMILDKMRYVLPEVVNIGREEITIQKQIYLFLQEQHHDKRLPSWLLSSGTLRILAMLAILNSADIPPVLFIEEIENGLDPRTLNLLVEEIRGILPEHQCIVTTHSPYFLDLVALRHIVVAERQEGNTEYYRPDDDERLNVWKEKFSAGNLYTMNKLTRA